MYGLIGKMTATPGNRDALVGKLEVDVGVARERGPTQRRLTRLARAAQRDRRMATRESAQEVVEIALNRGRHLPVVQIGDSISNLYNARRYR